MLRFNTFRAARYLRSKFVEGKYLLASEATDLELELLDLLRTMTKNAIGDVALEDAWQVSRLSTTQLLIKPGEAWFRGLPFINRFGKDQLVSGAVLSLGTVPVGVSASDDANGGGKILTFNNAATTPSNTYRIVVTAREELITDVQDAFLKNVNITEDTAQKIRLNFQINIVPESLQSETSVPYRDENSTSASVTNFPAAGGFASPNYVNRVMVTPSSGGNGELLAINVISGSEGIDGRDLELVLRNDPALGGGNPIPNSTLAQQAFSNGKLVDSNGSVFYVNAIFNDIVSTQVVIRIDKEPNQPNPEIVNGKTFTLTKREVYVTDDVNGTPQGRIHWGIADVVWDSSSHFVHDSVVTDLRVSIEEEIFYQKLMNEKFTLSTIGGGTFALAIDGVTLSWDGNVLLQGPSFSMQTISAGSGYLVDGGFLIYKMHLGSTGDLRKGTLSVTSTSSGTSISLSGSPSLASVSKGNIFVIGSESAVINAIDDVNKTITLATSVSTTGAATIYLDSYGPGVYPTDENTYVLATRSGSTVLVADIMTLTAGQSGKLGVPAPAGVVKARLYDAVDTTLPSGASATIDGVALANGDLVLFSNLGGGSVAEYTQPANGTVLTSLNPTNYVGLSWTTSSAFNLTSAVFQMENISGAALGTMVCAVYSDSAGTPNTVLGTSGVVNMNTLNTSAAGAVTFTFGSPVALSASTRYYFIVQATGTGGNQNFLQIFGTTPATGGATTEASTNGTGWTNDGSSMPAVILYGATVGAGNNEVYKAAGVGTSISWSPVGIFGGNVQPSAGDLIIFSDGIQFANQIAEFNGSTFQINNPVRYFNGTDFWEQSAIQTTALSDNSSGTVFSVTAAGSENIVVDFSLLRSSQKEVGTMWITNNGTNAFIAIGGVAASTIGVTFSVALVSGSLVLSYATTSTGSGATMKYAVKRWSDSGGGPTGLPSYNPGVPGTISNVAFVMSDNSGTPLNCANTFNVSSKTRVQMTFTYVLNRNPGTTVGDLEPRVNGQIYPRFISGVTLDGYYKEIDNQTIEFSTNLQPSPLSVEIVKRV